MNIIIVKFDSRTGKSICRPSLDLLLKLSICHGILQNRLLSIGLCLPQECSVNDVKIMLEEDSNVIRSTNPKRAIRVISVRAVPGQYSLFRDKKLHLVL